MGATQTDRFPRPENYFFMKSVNHDGKKRSAVSRVWAATCYTWYLSHIIIGDREGKW